MPISRPSDPATGRSESHGRIPRGLLASARHQRERDTMDERNILYERLTWPQIRDAARDDKVICIPFAMVPPFLMARGS